MFSALTRLNEIGGQGLALCHSKEKPGRSVGEVDISTRPKPRLSVGVSTVCGRLLRMSN